MVGDVGAGHRLAMSPPLPSSAHSAGRPSQSAMPFRAPAARASHTSVFSSGCISAPVGSNISSSQASSDGVAPPTPPPSQHPLAPTEVSPSLAPSCVTPGISALSPLQADPAMVLQPIVAPVMDTGAPGMTPPVAENLPATSPVHTRCSSRRNRGRGCSRSLSESSSQGTT